MTCPYDCDCCGFATELAMGEGDNIDILPGCLAYAGDASWDEVHQWWASQEPVLVTARPMGEMA